KGEARRDGTRLGLVPQLADGELDPPEFALPEHVEGIGLVLQWIARAEQMSPAVAAGLDAYVVARREPICAELPDDVAEQRVELHVLVARDAGVRRFSAGVRAHEIIDDPWTENLGVVERIERNAEHRGGPARILPRLVGPAAAGSVDVAAGRNEAHPHTNHVLAAIGQDRRGHR